MDIGKFRRSWGLVLGIPLLLTATGVSAVAFQGGSGLGGPIAGLSSDEYQKYEDGKVHFMEAESAQDGLGPVFNGTSCVQCHVKGAVGGSAPNVTIARVTRIGGIENGKYSDLPEYGGPVLQSRSLREIMPHYPIPAETVPKQAKYVSHRITTPLFGAGLIEAIPDEEIVALSKINQPDGIHGVPNYVHNPETGNNEIGKFGWKAQVSQLHWFAGDAYLNEMGITSMNFPHENLPQGKAIPAGADLHVDPEDSTNTDVDGFVYFMRYLAPPPQKPLTINALKGLFLFAGARCTSCHTPVLITGKHCSDALSYKPVSLYSDLLLHKMGTALADGIQQGSSTGDQFKTAPLWGLRYRSYFLHDGRATSPDQAILMHAGEAKASRDRYSKLSAKDKKSLLEFLAGL